MRCEQKYWTKESGWVSFGENKLEGDPQLVFAFGGRREIGDQSRFDEIRTFYPNAKILLCSTAGEIIDTQVRDNSIALTALNFEKTNLSFAECAISNADESKVVGQELASKLPKDRLVHAMVFSDGLLVNGTALVEGINSELPVGVSVTGGLVGDGADFKQTLVGLNGVGQTGKIVIVGFHSEALKVGYGSLGGWDPFGIERTITKSKNNILYELDGQSALKLYKEYLGDLANELPSSGLRFPLRLHGVEKNGTEVVRTLLAVSEEEQSMTFAGDMPEGSVAMLMKANFDRLIDGASGAGEMSKEALGAIPPDFAILISCIGRKLVLKERIEEETEAVRGVLGKGAVLTGFYSYGELCPSAATEKQCHLHNQTMTITTFREE